MLFAEDVVINAEAREEVEQRLEMWEDAMEKRGLRVSRKKIVYLRLTAVKTCHDRRHGVSMHGEE